MIVYCQPISSLLLHNHESLYLLCFLVGLGHGQEDAVKKYSSHDEVIEVLIRTQIDAALSQTIPRREYEPTLGRRKPMDVVLAESLGHHAERLKHTSVNAFLLSNLNLDFLQI